LNDTSTGFPVVLKETGPDGTIVYTRGRNLISATGALNAFYHYDAQSTIMGLTDFTGHLQQRYVYDVWGQRAQIVPASSNNATPNKFGYTGEALDPGTSLYFLRARYYDPSLGRFLTRDSFPGFDLWPQTLNRYVYVRNNPATLTDRTGHCFDDDPLAWPCAPPLP
jgi:RHS repeat-associated protein